MLDFQLARDLRADAASRAVALSTIGWALLLVGWGLVGLIVAGRGWRDATPRVRDNYRYMVRTFFIGTLYAAPAVTAWWLTGTIALVAILAAPAGVWHFVRCLEGLTTLLRDRPIADLETWLV